MENETLVFTVAECAEKLRISRPQAYLGIKRGDIPSIRVGRRILVPKIALDRMLSAEHPAANGGAQLLARGPPET